jgi:DNA-binding MarR family transcriptional regulator
VIELRGKSQIRIEVLHMGSLTDLLAEVPLAAVLRERVALVEEKYDRAIKENAALKRRVEELERENETLRAQIPAATGPRLGDDTARVLVHLFKAADMDDRDVGRMAGRLQMELGVMQYHLDRLQQAGYADVTGGDYVNGYVFWALTPAGRQHVVESKLI